MGHLKETRLRKWRKPVPCPTCGSRNIRFDRIAWAVNRKTSVIRQIWACSCERRRQLAQAWEAGYSAGWTDQQCDFPPHTADNPFKEDADE